MVTLVFFRGFSCVFIVPVLYVCYVHTYVGSMGNLGTNYYSTYVLTLLYHSSGIGVLCVLASLLFLYLFAASLVVGSLGGLFGGLYLAMYVYIYIV